MDQDIDYQAEMLASKIKHYLITTMGRTSTEADTEEFFRAFSFTMREEIMINWLTCSKTLEKKNKRELYFISMEYLPGRTLTNNISNLGAMELVQRVLIKLNRSLADVIACEPDPGLGNGGLGRLASCFLDSLATMHFPARAYGLRYQYGIFEQQLWNGVQIEAPDLWLTYEDPWQFRRDMRRVYVKFCGEAVPGTNIYGDEVYDLKNYESVRVLPYDVPIVGYATDANFTVNTLRLWTTKESPRNFQLQRYNAGQLDQAAENTTLTDVLYPSDQHDMGKRVRLKQEFLLVSSSLQDIIRHYLTQHENFREFADKTRIQINETHAALMVAELIRRLIKHHDIPWTTAIDITQQIIGYTNHTILKEALEEWDHGLLAYLLPRQTRVIEKLNQTLCDSIRNKFPGDENKVERMAIVYNNRVRMANLAIVGSHKVNGVAKLHTEILKSRLFKDFYELYPDRFINITNGVTQRRWLLECNRDLAKLITKRIGDGWITDFSEIKKFEAFAAQRDVQEEVMLIKMKNKQRLIDFLYQTNQLRNSEGAYVDPCPMIDPQSLFDMQVKRIHEYKRQMLTLLHFLMIYQEIKENPQSHGRIKRTLFIAGKAAAGYEIAKDIILLACCIGRELNRDAATNKILKLIYVENYNVTKAEMLIPAADLSEQISTAGYEASGTGNMKLAINGALTIGTEDGANIEMHEEVSDQWWPFSFGATSEQIQELKKSNTYSPQEICKNNPKIKNAIEMIMGFAKNEQETQSFQKLKNMLLEGYHGNPADSYFNLYDLQSYYDTQLKVEKLYRQPHHWTEYVIHNIAAMGPFSTDNSIKNYNTLIWGLEPVPPDLDIKARVEEEYRKHDKCRIY